LKTKKIIPTPQIIYEMPGKNIFKKNADVTLYCEVIDDVRHAHAVDLLQKKLGENALNIKKVGNAAQTDIILTADEKLAAGIIGREFISKLAKGKYASQQGYILAAQPDKPLLLYAQSPLGCLYAVESLLQLIEKKPDGVYLDNTIIIDYPDFLYRGNTWLIGVEASFWSYDFGDGTDAYKRRFVEKLDMLAQYKVNAVLVDGLGWSINKFPGYAGLMQCVNREARKRGVHIMTSGYGSGYGAASPGNGNLHQGEVHLNRYSYPDGEIYACQGMNYLPEHKQLIQGSCLSNEALYECKERELKQFVENVEPGAMYIHHIDEHLISGLHWKKRCPKCREIWPNDAYDAPDGAAGAYAYHYNHLARALNSVKKDGYDAEKDLLPLMVSPGYTWYFDTDNQWRLSVNYWTQVAKLIEAENVIITLREQYYDNAASPQGYATRRRFDILREAFDIHAPKVKTGCIYFGGSDGYYSDRNYTAVPVYHYTQLGIDGLFYAGGHAFQEPFQLLNAEYMWNSKKSAFYNVPKKKQPRNYFDAMAAEKAACYGVFRPEKLFGRDGFLNIACERLYGGKAGEIMAEAFRISGKSGLQPASFLQSSDYSASTFNFIFRMSWCNELHETEEKNFNKMMHEIRKLTEKAAEVTKKIKDMPNADETAVFIANAFEKNVEYLDALCLFTRLRIDLKSFILTGNGNAAQLESDIKKLASEGARLLKLWEDSNQKAIDYMGASMHGREKTAKFCIMNADWMEECLRDKKRFSDKEIQRQEWM